MNTVVEQLETIRDDQVRELNDLRAKRRAIKQRLSELDAEELELLLSISEVDELIKKWRK